MVGLEWLWRFLGVKLAESEKYIVLQGAYQNLFHLRKVVEETATHYHVYTPEALLGMLVPYSDEWVAKDDSRIIRVSIY